MPLHPVSDVQPVVFDPDDPTRQIRLDAGGVGAGQTRVLAMPDRDVDLGDVLGLGSGKGLVVRDRAGNFAARRIVAGSPMIYVTEGDGETGDPRIDVVPGNIDQRFLSFQLEDPVAGRAYYLGGAANASRLKWCAFHAMSGSLTLNVEKRVISAPEAAGTKAWTVDKTANTTSGLSPVTSFDSGGVAKYGLIFLTIVTVASAGNFYFGLIPEVDV